jgi:hypothetical protein
MSPNVIKTISIIGAALFAVAVVGIATLVIGVEDQSLYITLVALISSGSAVDFYQRLSRRYPNDGEAG